ncbi:cysteine hydrolase family protein [Micromonospora sp. NPDC000442]|uniref:cysteine hydrolase family protein n=1 Tax=Micromonospora sp. NPDC000442 TaxID=3364217 RepID=UPI0036BABB18
MRTDMAAYREIYRETGDGGVQLGASADRWYLYEDHVHLAPHHTEGQLVRFDAELLPFVDNLDRGALAVVDMQNDFCAPGGWTERSGLDHEACRAAIPGVQRAIDAARRHGMFVIWIYWHNRPDLRNLGAPTLHSFKHRLDQAGIGEDLDNGAVLTAGSWGAEMVDELKGYLVDDDIHVEKVRMSGFYGTHLDQVLRTQGIQTLYVCGVNADQCVSTTLEDAYFRDYNPVLIADATATSSPAYCKDAVLFNTKQCWGFVTTTDAFANPQPYERKGRP